MNTAISLMIVALSLFSTLSTSQTPDPTSPPFKFRYLFTAHLEFGPVVNEIPIVIPGGTQFVVPIIGGSVIGPAANGSITGGTAYGLYYNNGTYQLPQVAIFGQLNGTDDSTPFFVTEDGVDTTLTHASKINVNTAGDEYSYLREGFILARRYMAENGTSLDAICYLVEDS